MKDYENLKFKLKDVRQIEDFKTLSDEEIKSMLKFLYELAEIDIKINTTNTFHNEKGNYLLSS